MGQEFAQHGARARVDREVEMDVQAVLGVVRTLARQGEALEVRAHRFDLDVRKPLKLVIHRYPPTPLRDTSPSRAVKETRRRLDFASEVVKNGGPTGSQGVPGV